MGWERKVPAGQGTHTLSFPCLVQGVCRNFPVGSRGTMSTATAACPGSAMQPCPWQGTHLVHGALPAGHFSPGAHRVQHQPTEGIQVIPEGQDNFSVDLRVRLDGSTRPCWLRSMEQSWQPGGCDPLASSHSTARSTCGQGEGRLQRAWVQSEHPRAAGLGHHTHWASSHAQQAPEPQPSPICRVLGQADASALQGWQQGRTARGSPVPTDPGLGMPQGSPCAGLSPRSLSNWFLTSA